MKQAKNEPQKPPRKKETLAESISGIAAVLVSGLFIITFIVQAFEIPTGSMENTLLVGDHVFVDRLTPGMKAGYVGPLMAYRDIQRGDVIVFLSPVERNLYVVKRVIGIPGDRIHLKDGVVYRNGVALNEPYVLHDPDNYDPYRDNFPSVKLEHMPEEGAREWPLIMQEHIVNGELVVPPGDYFGMGDHRDVSLDSRYWGFIPRENIVGQPLFLYWSFDSKGHEQPMTVGDRLSSLVYVVTHFFTQTRWSRMFHLVH